MHSTAPFSFGRIEPTQQLSQMLIENADVREAEVLGDLSGVAPLLANFANSRITADSFPRYDHFSKLLRVCQLAVDCYMQTQERGEAMLADRIRELEALRAKAAKLEQIQHAHEGKAKTLAEEMARLREEK